MGSLVGHVLPGLGFFLIGLWHLFNNIKLHAQNPHSYTSQPWFPTSKIRYLELFLIMIGSSISISMELFIGPARHHPFDVDGTIPSYHLRNFEHASISMTFLVYAVSAIALDRAGAKIKNDLSLLLGGMAFGQQLLMFHLHSTDHVGIEGQYHLLLQILISIALATTLMGIAYPKSFIISFVRSISILYQGLWLIVMGVMLWTPEYIPKGCFLRSEEGHQVVHCRDEASVHRAKALINIEFSWYVIGMAMFSVIFYMFLDKVYGEKVKYRSLGEEQDEEEGEALSPEKIKLGFIHMGALTPMDIER